jgi:hypothetical protein
MFLITLLRNPGKVKCVYYLLPFNEILILGVLIGAQGKNVKTLRAATKCEISLVTSNYEGRAVKTKKYDTEPQVSSSFFHLKSIHF